MEHLYKRISAHTQACIHARLQRPLPFKARLITRDVPKQTQRHRFIVSKGNTSWEQSCTRWHNSSTFTVKIIPEHFSNLCKQTRRNVQMLSASTSWISQWQCPLNPHLSLQTGLDTRPTSLDWHAHDYGSGKFILVGLHWLLKRY